MDERTEKLLRCIPAKVPAKCCGPEFGLLEMQERPVAQGSSGPAPREVMLSIRPTANERAEELLRVLPRAPSRRPATFLGLYRQLAEGSPVALPRLAAAVGLPLDELRRRLESWPGVYYNTMPSGASSATEVSRSGPRPTGLHPGPCYGRKGPDRPGAGCRVPA
jgi:hypothetical protein